MKLNEMCGTGVAIITPFQENGSIDFSALERMINHVIEGGVQNIVTLGTTGEVPTLSIDEKKEIIRFTIKKVNKRVPVIAGIGGNNTKEIVYQLNSFPLEDVAAILSVAPYYSKPSPEGLYQHYKAVSKASPKPVILYNVPGRTAITIPAEIVLRLARDFENIVGVKDATGDLALGMDIIRQKPEDFTVVSGDDLLTMPQISIGMEGVISVAANIYPEEISELVRLTRKQNFAEARKIQYKLLPAMKYMFKENSPAGVKAFLETAGLIQEQLRLPVVPVSKDLKENIRQYFAKN
ncbi:MAG TPA: 4-hydroxy-tetrahydrodipicolinate synthase [Chitinophagaceae bacterium]|nr:4-hydroxy-tetrahydrodipicolinate synthase [Chitinophagaceae bacterium]